MNGFINVFKPTGKTSHDVVNQVRKILHEKRVGHTGTLDPDATGVLPIAVGKSTRLIDFLSSDKSYQFEMILGFETDSGDLTGKIINRLENFVMPTENEILQTFKKFTGEIEQTPPKYSAIKIHGKKAYELARKDIEFNIPSRRVKIYQLTLLQLNKVDKTIKCNVSCSKGTYIRSLCQDVGHELKIPATMKNLIRTQAGKFFITDSIQLEDISSEKILQPEDCIDLPQIALNDKRSSAFCNGLSTKLNMQFDSDHVKVFDEVKNFIGIGFIKDSELFPKVVIK